MALYLLRALLHDYVRSEGECQKARWPLATVPTTLAYNVIDEGPFHINDTLTLPFSFRSTEEPPVDLCLSLLLVK